jgi:tetratricopeptide (TPR) repeat protein
MQREKHTMKARLTSLSRADACAHLLRHLNDAAAVRINPLVEHLFGEQPGGARLLSTEREALSEVRALVRAAAEALRLRDQSDTAAIHAQRQHTILTRCDLNQERHEDVADDLGLSLSQFYRERRAARTWVADYLTKHSTRAKPASMGAKLLDPFAFDVAHARTLRNAGDYDRAITLLQELTDKLDRSSQRLEVYCLLVKFLTDARRYGEIHLALQAARECFTNLRLADADDIDEHRGRLEMATADYYWAIGDSVAAIAANERAVASFRSIRYKPGSNAEGALADALLDLVHGYLSVGRFREASAAVAQARTVIDDLPTPAPQLQAGFLIGLGFLQTNALDTMGDAIPTLHRARDIAHAHRLGKEAIWATAGLSMHAQFHGDLATATEYIEECCSIGKRLLTPFDHSNLLLRMLELKAISAPQEALALAARLRSHFTHESAGWMKTTIFSAMASLTAGDFVTALQTSALASEVAARKSDYRLHGAALRIQAAAGANLGQLDAARSSIERAIEVLQTHGSPYILLLTYEDSSRITGNNHHAANAIEMRTTVLRRAALTH